MTAAAYPPAPFALGKYQREWVAELESGKWPKTCGTLILDPGDADAKLRFCCLGVACMIFGAKIHCNAKGDYDCDGELTTLPPAIMQRLKLRTDTGDHLTNEDVSLASINDMGGSDFAEVIHAIKTAPEYYFTGPA